MTTREALQTVDFQVKDHIAHIYLNRPERLNAVNARLVDDLCEALDRANAQQVRAALLGGHGRAFCAGYDLRQSEAPVGKAEAQRRLERIQDITRKVRQAPFPVIALVQGYALGAGCEFALCSDLIVAARDAQFGFLEVSVGLSITGGISRLLPLAVGLARAKELVLGGERFGAEEAARMGLINRVVEAVDLAPTGLALAKRMRDFPPQALSLAKAVLDHGSEMSLENAMALEVSHALITMGSEEADQGADRFQKRRSPTARKAR
jgi:enoyl-CoA hydratase/carnithine racemase